MTFDQLLSAVLSESELVIPSSWSQGRASFGGLTTGLLLARMQSLVAVGRSVRSMQVSFIGPVEADVLATFETEMLREGRAVSQMMGRIVQNGQTRLVCLVSFSANRDSKIRVDALPAPEMPDVAQCRELPFIEGITPGFIQYIQMRWALGGLPFSGKGEREIGGWMRFREPATGFADAHLVALVDSWPPGLLSFVKAPTPASSLNWTLDIVHPRPELKPSDWLFYRAVIDQAAFGYGHSRAEIWTARGELVALSRQTVAVFG